MPPNPEKLPLIIGRNELLDFPEWGVRRVRVKIDTGARTSALDALEGSVEGGLIGEAALAGNFGKGPA